MKKTLSLILATVMALAAFAAETAESVLNATTSKINNAQSLTATFTATSGDGTVSKGELTIAKERFSMVTPDFGVWYNGNDMWSYYKQSGEVSLTNPTDDELLEINPFDILNHYSTHYKAKMLKGSTSHYNIELTPLSHGASVAKAVIAIEKSNKLPSRIDATFANGSTLSIIITSIKENQAVPAKSMFEFPASKYPGALIIDLR